MRCSRAAGTEERLRRHERARRPNQRKVDPCGPGLRLGAEGAARLSSEFLVALVDDGELDSLLLGERDERLVVLTDDEDVGQSGGEGVVDGVLDGDDVEGAGVTLNVLHGTDAAAVAALGDHAGRAELELDEIDDLPRLEVDLGDVVDLDEGVGIADSLAVVGRHDRDLLRGDVDVVHAAQFELLLLVRDPVEHEPPLGVIEEPELVARGRHRDHVHETRRERRVRTHLAVNLDVLRHANHLRLLTRDRVLQPIPQNQDQGQALPQLVGPSRRPRGERPVHLPQHPVLWRIDPLQMLLRTASHPPRDLSPLRGCPAITALCYRGPH
mmetsp:Transcript_10313/g.33014  ORF Transcript_10313/g.33014 Transcript_10313/m.33014 type:complete len:326 (-) Transcript_10313:40-1017(-)